MTDNIYKTALEAMLKHLTQPEDGALEYAALTALEPVLEAARVESFEALRPWAYVRARLNDRIRWNAENRTWPALDANGEVRELDVPLATRAASAMRSVSAGWEGQSDEDIVENLLHHIGECEWEFISCVLPVGERLESAA